MKKMLDYLESDREGLMLRLQAAPTPGDAQTILEKEADRLLLQYNQECDSARVRYAAAGMIQALRSSVSLLDSMGEPHIWIEEKYEDGHGAPGTGAGGKRLTVILLAAGVILTLAAFMVPALNAGGTAALGALLKAVLLPVAGGGCLYFAGRTAVTGAKIGMGSSPQGTGYNGGSGTRDAGYNGASTGGGTRDAGYNGASTGGGAWRTDGSGSTTRQNAYGGSRRVEFTVDPEKLWHSLRGTVMVIDRNLEFIREEEDAERRRDLAAASGARGISAGEIELFSGLLEQADADSPQMASDIRYYLHKKDVEALPFSEQRAAWFEILPSAAGAEPVTIRPALVQDGKLLKKGVAVR